MTTSRTTARKRLCVLKHFEEREMKREGNEERERNEEREK